MSILNKISIKQIPLFSKLAYLIKMSRNLHYIKRNKKQVLKKLKTKEVLNVVFYVYDSTKWKCQSLYDLLIQDKRFNVKILVTKNCAENIDNPSYQTVEDVKKTYEFFTSKNMNVEYAYDIENNKFIPFEKFSPDIIIYQHPWYVETTQGPVVCSKFALTCYVPYNFPNTTAPIEYYLRFHQYIERYYVLDERIKSLYSKNMENKGSNLKVCGYPFLDYFRFNKSETEKTYTIYAPHWTLCGKGLACGTFEWSGKFMLEYAKKHPEKNWVFKPHPLLFKALIDNNLMTAEEARNYYNEWAKIGLKCESGDYLDLFNESNLMITDCCSFLGEYFLTKNPVIHLISNTAPPYNETVQQIVKTYYRAENQEDLTHLLDELPDNDPMRETRLTTLKELGFENNYAAKNILQDILNTIKGAAK